MFRQTSTGKFDLDATFADTYFGLRWGIVALATGLPLLLWWGGRWIDGVELQDSISAYYNTGMRDWLVGILFAVAACLYLYKGLSDRENYLLNAAAVFAVGVAMDPFDWRPTWWPATDKITPHGIFAALFFLAIALACWLCQDDSLNLGLIAARDQRAYRAKYAATGMALVLFPAVAVLLNAGLFNRPFQSSVFWAEAAAIWVLAFYWYTKSGELKKAMQGQGQRRGAARAAGG